MSSDAGLSFGGGNIIKGDETLREPTTIVKGKGGGGKGLQPAREGKMVLSTDGKGGLNAARDTERKGGGQTPCRICESKRRNDRTTGANSEEEPKGRKEKKTQKSGAQKWNAWLRRRECDLIGRALSY